MKLTDILREIGEASSSPYKYKYIKETKEAYFTTDEGTQYKVSFWVDPTDKQMEIRFGVVDSSDNMDYEIDTNEGNLFRVMSTIMKIINQAVSELKPNTILFSAAKSDPRRMNMYRKYITTNLKEYSIVQDMGGVMVLQRDSLGKKLKQSLKIGKK
jgi:hypothetical protein